LNDLQRTTEITLYFHITFYTTYKKIGQLTKGKKNNEFKN